MHATAGHWEWWLGLQVEESDIALFKYGPRENNNNEKSYTQKTLMILSDPFLVKFYCFRVLRPETSVNSNNKKPFSR